jgi:hypothetical protein
MGLGSGKFNAYFLYLTAQATRRSVEKNSKLMIL